MNGFNQKEDDVLSDSVPRVKWTNGSVIHSKHYFEKTESPTQILNEQEVFEKKDQILSRQTVTRRHWSGDKRDFDTISFSNHSVHSEKTTWEEPKGLLTSAEPVKFQSCFRGKGLQGLQTTDSANSRQITRVLRLRLPDSRQSQAEFGQHGPPQNPHNHHRSGRTSL